MNLLNYLRAPQNSRVIISRSLEGQRRVGPDSRRKLQNEDWEGQSSFSASDDDMLAS